MVLPVAGRRSTVTDSAMGEDTRTIRQKNDGDTAYEVCGATAAESRPTNEPADVPPKCPILSDMRRRAAMAADENDRDEEASGFDPARPRPRLAGGPEPLGRQPLIRLLAINWLIGAGVAVLLVATVLITDTARLRSLMFASGEPWIPLMLLFFGFLVTMSSVAMATAVMMLPSGDDDQDGGGAGATVAPPAPVPLRVPVGRPRR
jgi:hypothetical protein